MATEYTSPAYVQSDGTIVRHYVCDTENEKPTSAPGSTAWVRESNKFYVRNENSSWQDTASGQATAPGGSEAFPVGSVFIAVVATDPATLLGYGTWVAFGAGRVLIGNDGATFGTDEATGGASTAAVSAHAGAAVAQHAAAATGAASAGATQRGTTASTLTLSNHTHNTPVLSHVVTQPSDHSAVSTIQPYIVVHMWKRTA